MAGGAPSGLPARGAWDFAACVRLDGPACGGWVVASLPPTGP